MTVRVLAILGAMVIALGTIAPAPAGTTSKVGAGFDASSAVADGDLVAFLVSEVGQDGTDLNGDADTNDDVLHVHDRSTGTTTKVGAGFDVTLFEVRDGIVGFIVSEAGQMADLNADTDMLDDIAYAYDHATSTVTEIGGGLAAAPGSPLVEGGDVVFRVEESEQGLLGTDLNADLDMADQVLHVFDVGAAALSVPLGGLDAGSLMGSGDGLVAFGVSEAGQGATDLNADTDMTDTVLHTYDPATDTAAKAGTGFDFDGLGVGGGLVVLAVDEAGQGAGGGTDLNADGDMSDDVPHLFDPGAGTVAKVGAGFAALADVLQVNASHGAFLVSEAGQGVGGTDLNGDGDTGDDVPHTFDVATGVVSVAGTGFASDSEPLFLDRSYAAFSVFETGQGADLNGDGDTGDRLPYIADAVSGQAWTPGLAMFGDPLLSGTRIAFLVEEADQGPAGTDLNADGDTADDVLHVFDAMIGVPVKVGPGFSTVDFEIGGSRVAFHVEESADGGADHNGDGDSSDDVLFLFDAGAGVLDTSLVPIAIAATPDLGPDSFSARLLAFRVSEASEAATDLNGDADPADDVVHVHEFDVCEGLPATIEGTAAADTIAGTPGDDVILARGGNDTIDGRGGDDLICAGDGDDVIVGGAGDDTIRGEGGTDTADYADNGTAIVADLGTGVVTGASTDTLTSVENVIGSDHDDTIVGDAGPNVLSGGDGADHLAGGDGNDELMGEGGDDRLAGEGGDDTLLGAGGSDLLIGGAGDDDLEGGAGGDTSRGGPGKDVHVDGPGKDVQRGGAGKDTLKGEGGRDKQNGGGGRDRLVGGGGKDTQRGGGGNDVLKGNKGNDTQKGGGGNDTLRGAAGKDAQNGGPGKDSCKGGGGKDPAPKNCE